jgi:hypothetical protein
MSIFLNRSFLKMSFLQTNALIPHAAVSENNEFLRIGFLSKHIAIEGPSRAASLDFCDHKDLGHREIGK